MQHPVRAPGALGVYPAPIWAVKRHRRQGRVSPVPKGPWAWSWASLSRLPRSDPTGAPRALPQRPPLSDSPRAPTGQTRALAAWLPSGDAAMQGDAMGGLGAGLQRAAYGFFPCARLSNLPFDASEESVAHWLVRLAPPPPGAGRAAARARGHQLCLPGHWAACVCRDAPCTASLPSGRRTVTGLMPFCCVLLLRSALPRDFAHTGAPGTEACALAHTLTCCEARASMPQARRSSGWACLSTAAAGRWIAVRGASRRSVLAAPFESDCLRKKAGWKRSCV